MRQTLLAAGATALITAAALVAPNVAGDARAADPTPRRTEKTFPAKEGATLTVRADHGGNFKISGWDRPEIHVLAVDRLANVDISFIEEKNGGLTIKAEHEKPLGFRINTDISFEIQVPKRFQIDVHTSGGNVDLAGLEGKMAAETMGGNLKARGLAGTGELKTMGGNIEVHDTSMLGRFQTMGGNIAIRGAKSEIDVETMGGNIDIVAGAKVRAASGGGDIEIELTGKGGDCEAKTHGGDIVLFVPAGFSGSFEVRAMDVTNKLEGLQFVHDGKHYVAERFKGKLGEGEHKVILETAGGDVTIRGAR